MAAKKKSKPHAVPSEWLGFPDRLNLAVATRIRQNPGMSQNDIATAAEVDSGNFSKILAGSKKNVVVPTVMQLAKALRVEIRWLIYGIEPSGLDPTHPPSSVVDVQVFDGVATGPSLDQVSKAASEGEIQRPSDVVRRSEAKRNKR